MKKETTKRILIAILIVTLFNFISPTISHGSIGGVLFAPISEFFTYIGDLVIESLQYYFLKEELVEEDKIKYSPGVIFSNRIPTFDINFFKPASNKTTYKYEFVKMFEGEFIDHRLIVNYKDFNNGMNSYGYNEKNIYEEEPITRIMHVDWGEEDEEYFEKYEEKYDDVDYDTWYNYHLTETDNEDITQKKVDDFKSYVMFSSNDVIKMVEKLFKVQRVDTIKPETHIPEFFMKDRELKVFVDMLFNKELGDYTYEYKVNIDNYKSKSGTYYNECTYMYLNMKDLGCDFELILNRDTGRTNNGNIKSKDMYIQLVINSVNKSNSSVYELYKAKEYYNRTSQEGERFEIAKDLIDSKTEVTMKKDGKEQVLTLNNIRPGIDVYYPNYYLGYYDIEDVELDESNQIQETIDKIDKFFADSYLDKRF